MIGTKTNNIWTNLETEEILSRFNDRDVKITHSGYHRVSLFKSDDQSIVKDTWVDLNFDNEVFDIGDLHDNVINNERVRVKKDGTYLITFQVEWDGKENNLFKTRIAESDVLSIREFPDTAGKDGIIANKGTVIVDLLATDYLALQVMHNSVSNKNVLSNETFFIVNRIF